MEAASPRATLSFASIVERVRRRGLAATMWRAGVRGVEFVVGCVLWGVFTALTVVHRFQVVKVRCDRIGHLTQNTDIFLREVRLSSDDATRIGIAAGRVANQRLLAVFQRQLFITRNPLAVWLLATLRFTAGPRLYVDLENYDDAHVRYHQFRAAPSNVIFTPREEEEGRSILRNIGLGLDDWFVCFHARDAAYLNANWPGVNWQYHSYRDCDIASYLDAARHVTRQGGWALRMGQVVARPLNCDEPRLVDYATRHRSEWGDVYLPARCKFFLGSTGGLFLMAVIAGRPVACANYYLEILSPFSDGDLFIPKMAWSIEGQRLLTFREMLHSGAGRWTSGDQFAKAGLELVENSASEVLDLAREMNGRLDGTYQGTEEDEELQARFRALFEPHHFGRDSPVRIGAAFLRQHRALLD